jgi:hypothetical protein
MRTRTAFGLLFLLTVLTAAFLAGCNKSTDSAANADGTPAQTKSLGATRRVPGAAGDGGAAPAAAPAPAARTANPASFRE